MQSSGCRDSQPRGTACAKAPRLRLGRGSSSTHVPKVKWGKKVVIRQGCKGRLCTLGLPRPQTGPEIPWEEITGEFQTET